VGKEKCLITGANGFIGRAITAKLSADKLNLKLVVRNPKNAEGYDHFLVNSIDENTDWSDAFDDVHSVVHIAGLAHVLSPSNEAELKKKFESVNTFGTLRLAREAALAGVKRFVFISTIGVNGVSNKLPFTAKDVPAPVDFYAESKLNAELGLSEIAEQTGMEIVIIRPPLVYGPGAPGNFGRLAKLAQTGLPLPLGAIHNRKSFVGIDNLVDFIATCLAHPNAAGKILLVSDDCDVSTTELLKVMAKASGKRALLIPVPVGVLRILGKLVGQQGTIERLCESLSIDISESKTILGWKPVLSLTEGVRKCYSSTSSSEAS
jgi:UDP-glucose 4-epimerase